MKKEEESKKHVVIYKGLYRFTGKNRLDVDDYESNGSDMDKTLVNAQTFISCTFC